MSNQQGLVYDGCFDLCSHLDLNLLEPGWVTAGTRKSAWGPSQAELPVWTVQAAVGRCFIGFLQSPSQLIVYTERILVSSSPSSLTFI